jgi:hypothetical protein
LVQTPICIRHFKKVRLPFTKPVEFIAS